MRAIGTNGLRWLASRNRKGAACGLIVLMGVAGGMLCRGVRTGQVSVPQAQGAGRMMANAELHAAGLQPPRMRLADAAAAIVREMAVVDDLDLGLAPAISVVPVYPGGEEDRGQGRQMEDRSASSSLAKAAPDPLVIVESSDILRFVATKPREAEAIARTLNRELAAVDSMLDRAMVTQKCRRAVAAGRAAPARGPRGETCFFLNALYRAEAARAVDQCVRAVVATFRLEWAARAQPAATDGASGENGHGGALLVQLVSRDKLETLASDEVKADLAMEKVARAARHRRCE